MLQTCACGDAKFRISDSTPSMHLVKSRETSCRENVSSRHWMERSHVLPTPLVSLEMLNGSQKRATLCTSFVSVTIVSHCFTGCSCLTMLCGVVNKCQFCVCSNKVWAQRGDHTHFVDGSGSCTVVDLCHGVNLWEDVSPLRAISHVNLEMLSCMGRIRTVWSRMTMRRL